MKNKSSNIALALALSLSVVSMPAHAAEKKYNITYSPGLLGEFKESLIEEYKKTYGAEDVTVSEVTGSVTVKVAISENMPMVDPSDVVFKNEEDAEQYYVLTNGWGPASMNPVQNETFVVQYGALVDGVDYTIRYVDDTTNTDVAMPEMGKANVDETIAAYAKVVEGYTFDTQSKMMTLTKDEEKNVLTFYYTAEDDTIYVDQIITEVIPGDVIVVQPPVAGEENEPTTTPNEPVEDVEDNDTPLANGDKENGEDVEENETPLANNELEKNNKMLYTTIGVIAVLGILLAIFVAMKKKKQEE